MKIGKSTEGLANLQSLGTPGAGGSRAAGKSAGAAAGGDVRISDLSSQLHALESRLSAEPAFDADKVEKLKDAIKNGDFKVNADAVADKLISSVQELIQRKNG